MERSEKEKIKEKNTIWEYVYRKNDEIEYPLCSPILKKQETYPWEKKELSVPPIYEKKIE